MKLLLIVMMRLMRSLKKNLLPMILLRLWLSGLLPPPGSSLVFVASLGDPPRHLGLMMMRPQMMHLLRPMFTYLVTLSFHMVAS